MKVVDITDKSIARTRILRSGLGTRTRSIFFFLAQFCNYVLYIFGTYVLPMKFTTKIYLERVSRVQHNDRRHVQFVQARGVQSVVFGPF